MIVSLDRPASTSPTTLRPRRQVARPGGGAVAYVEAGEGEPVVLIHGALTNLDDMVIGPFDALARNHRVIAVDRPGRVAINWGVYGVPETYFIDGGGIVRWRYAGALTDQVVH